MGHWRERELEEADVPPPQKRAANLLAALAFAVHGGIERALADDPQPLSLAAAAVLNTVRCLPRLQPVELSLAVGVSPSACIRVVNQLVRKGLIGREPFLYDARGSVLHLTPEGERVARASAARQSAFIEALASRVPPYWLPRLIRVFEVLLSVLTPETTTALAACRHCNWSVCRDNDATPCPIVESAFRRRATLEAERARAEAIPWWHDGLPPEERPPLPPLEISTARPGSGEAAGRLMLAIALEETSPGPRRGRRRRR